MEPYGLANRVCFQESSKNAGETMKKHLQEKLESAAVPNHSAGESCRPRAAPPSSVVRHQFWPVSSVTEGYDPYNKPASALPDSAADEKPR
jgi:hypothetical protein